MSSAFGLCLVPVIPSATEADRRLSIALRSAIVSAAGNKPLINSKLIGNALNVGSEFGTPPNRDSIVSTGKSKS
jgi:hypothetical protein